MQDPTYEYRKAYPFETIGPAFNAGVASGLEATIIAICQWFRSINLNGELPAGDEGDIIVVEDDAWVADTLKVPFTNIIQDLGVARRSGTFDIASSGLTADMNVQIFQSAQAVASKGNARDEFEMDAVVATGYVVDASTIRAYWFAANGSVIVGDVAFAYHVGR